MDSNYYENLPKKRMGSAVLFLNEKREILTNNTAFYFEILE
jgi:hypothetical protein